VEKWKTGKMKEEVKEEMTLSYSDMQTGQKNVIIGRTVHDIIGSVDQYSTVEKGWVDGDGTCARGQRP
jgi:hypothetical protein